MMAITARSALFAVRNVARHGDTDVFPFPLENHWFHDSEVVVTELLMQLDSDFDNWLRSYPVNFVTGLSSVGYNGFRAATQIDPIWNAYLLALLIEIGSDIESARLPIEKELVFSYRFKPSDDRNTLFDPEIGWSKFHRTALARAGSFEFIVSTDISDFYPRIYHHRLENALNQATRASEVVRRTMEILKRLSGGTSFGLPVGGNAARLLAELLLNRTDRLLRTSKVQFCRFVDDYLLFADSAGSAQTALVQLSEILLANEGLTLARAKTRIMSKSEFVRSSPLAEPTVADSADEAMVRQFLGIRLAYDPYSPTADDQYELLRGELQRFDITGMLARELHKSRVDEGVARQLVKSMRFLQPELRDAAVSSIVRNLRILYPIFPSVAILLHQLLAELFEETRREVFETIRALIIERSHILLVPANLSFAIHILAFDRAEENDALLIDVYHHPKTDMMVKRDVLLAMTRRRVDYWLSEQLKRFAVLTPWEKRALIVASYILGDEGRHWRERIRTELQETDRQFMRWVGEKNNGRVWEVPL
jgi:hypothetical protein